MVFQHFIVQYPCDYVSFTLQILQSFKDRKDIHKKSVKFVCPHAPKGLRNARHQSQ